MKLKISNENINISPKDFFDIEVDVFVTTEKPVT